MNTFEVGDLLRKMLDEILSENCSEEDCAKALHDIFTQSTVGIVTLVEHCSEENSGIANMQAVAETLKSSIDRILRTSIVASLAGEES